MFDDMSAGSVYSDVMMQRRLDRRPFLIVEGPADQSALYPHVADDRCLIIVAHGRENVLGAMGEVVANNVRHVVALVDGDNVYGHEDDRTRLSGVITTDKNDLDSEILHLPALANRVAFSHAEGRLVSAELRKLGLSDVLVLITRIVIPVTRLRYMCVTRGVEVATKGFPFSAAYDKSGASFDVDAAVPIVVSKMSDIDIKKFGSEISLWLERCDLDDDSLRDFHNGHDLFSALHTFLRKGCGYKPKLENLENAVRGTASWEEFSSIGCIGRISTEFEGMGFWIWRAEFTPSG